MSISNCINSLNRNKQKIQNYIFQGGSVKGLAYIGALEELERNGIKVEKIKRMGGTSVGAITATLISIGYDLNELNKELKELDFKDFIDIEDKELSDFVCKKFLYTSDIKVALKNECEKKIKNYEKESLVSLLYKVYTDFKTGYALVKKLMNNKGLAEGKVIRDWMEEKIFIKTGFKNATFAELNRLHEKNPQKYKQLYLIGGNASQCKSEVFSHENTPDLIISDAVRISMSIPVLFKPHQFYEKVGNERKCTRKDLYIDGGVFDNYPIWLFDCRKYFDESCDHFDREKRIYNSESLGFRLEPFVKTLDYNLQKGGVLDVYKSKNDQEWNFLKEWNLHYFYSIFKCFYLKQESDFNHTSQDDTNRTIFIDDQNIPMLKFNLTHDDKIKLIAAGKKDAVCFLDRWTKAETDTKGKLQENQIYEFLMSLILITIVLPYFCPRF